MSMFYLVIGHGRYDKDGKNWDDGITRFSRPLHQTKHDARETCGINMNLDKSTCPLVQQVDCTENNGKRQVTLLVKAMGYQHAEDRAKAFCDKTFKPKKMPKSKQISNRKDAFDIFNALPRGIAQANSLFGDYNFEYYKEGFKNNDRFQSRRSAKSVSGHEDKRGKYVGKKRNYDRS